MRSIKKKLCVHRTKWVTIDLLEYYESGKLMMKAYPTNRLKPVELLFNVYVNQENDKNGVQVDKYGNPRTQD